jgi:hypothetical protein
MKKIAHIIAKVILSAILLLPVVGSTGLLGEPTRELYNTDLAFAFIQTLASVMYINYIMSGVIVLALVALWTKREALAALLIAPITVNVVGFHLFIDGGLLTGGAVLANIMLLINVYLLYKSRDAYKTLLDPTA